MKKILELKNIYVGNEEIKILKNINFEVKKGEVLSIVGESGCGKSMTLRTIIKLLPKNIKILKGKILFNELDITEIQDMERIRGKEIGIIFQEPSSYLNPLFTIGNQIEEAIKNEKSKKLCKEKVFKILQEVGLPENVYYLYPHQLSGGMQQRAMIAMAIVNNPFLLLADEPTTALDVTTALGIINLLKNLVATHNLSVIFVTHDISLARFISDTIIVMYAGFIIEKGTSEEIYNQPLHPYTKKLINCLPEKYRKRERILTIEGEVPSLKNLPSGCPFSNRCDFKIDICEKYLPGEIKFENRIVRCFKYGNIVES
ncbi:MAG: ABC transporter ATP-binding protein [Candidatus Omnitrophica bacterium]|nr:ABC transporter ATP-binding protein [Candidatus Omnitrophota bacterium]MCM8807464.1 ABC transporter ATP-binding protein [Candidatus Omnitrophota bacterium]